MKLHTILLSAALMLLPLSVSAQAMSDADITAAITAGKTNKFSALVSVCGAGMGFGESLAAGATGGLQRTGSFTVYVSLNAGRIALLSAQAHRLHKPFSIADVPDTLKGAPAIYVAVEPDNPSHTQTRISVASPIEHVVLKAKKDETAVIQPVTFETEAVSWQNLMGAEVVANRALVTFDLGDMMELPAGDIDVVTVTQHGERRCKVSAKDRTRLVSR
jgi:hypothetical protein